ncbi:MAG: methyltransferase domain-containing protein [Candidatus Lokiarchaeota archaeon]|nr:methyltransferase domain-containing protein [Candidatus Lokiarchaeota archaeon]
MYNVLFPSQVYRFPYVLRRFNREQEVDKTVLDCGAGGSKPSLALFHELGYETHGIDTSNEQVKKAKQFCKENGLELGIQIGDMREIPFENESFGLVYSYNSIFHLTKADSAEAMNEMRRVLKKPGYLYVNFLSVEDQQCGQGEKVGPGEWKSTEHGEPTVHSYYKDTEPEQYFEGMEILFKEKRSTEFRVLPYRMVSLEYIAEKT